MVRLSLKILIISSLLALIQTLLFSAPVLAQAQDITTCRSFLANYGNSNGIANILDWTNCVAEQVQPTPTPTPPGTMTTNSPASADAYVSSSDPGTNFGRSSSLTVQGDPQTISYLTFTLPVLPPGATIRSATLQIKAANSTSFPISLSTVTSTNWDETQINYNNRPVLSSPIANITSTTQESWVTFDITSLASQSPGQTISLALTTPDDRLASFYSREAPADHPYLSIRYQGHPQIVFASSRGDNGNNWDIYLMNLDGSNVIRLTEDPARDEQPVFSPDDTKIAFVSERNGNPEIYIMNVDGSGLKRLTTNSVADRSPSYSPDGRTIVYSSATFTPAGSVTDIYTMDADTGDNKTRLTTSTAYDSKSQPSYSHQGDVLVYTGVSASPNYEIFTLNLQTGTSTAVTNNDWHDSSAHFSPDDSQILFQSYRQPPPEGPYPKIENNDIFIIDRDGNNEIQLTSEQSEEVQPAISPDGAKIAFASSRSGGYDIYLMDVDGSNVTQLTDNPSLDYFPSFNHASTDVPPPPPSASCPELSYVQNSAIGRTCDQLCGDWNTTCISTSITGSSNPDANNYYGAECQIFSSTTPGAFCGTIMSDINTVCGPPHGAIPAMWTRCVCCEYPTPTPAPDNAPCTTDSQCQSNKCGTDNDSDNYYVPGPGTCQPADKIAGDCYDQNALAHPGQTSYSYLDRGDGSYDFNCDNIEEKSDKTNCRTTLTGSINVCTATRPIGKNGYQVADPSEIPDCGQAKPWVYCLLFTTNSCSTLKEVTGFDCSQGCHALATDGTPITSWRLAKDPGWTMACR